MCVCVCLHEHTAGCDALRAVFAPLQLLRWCRCREIAIPAVPVCEAALASLPCHRYRERRNRCRRHEHRLCNVLHLCSLCDGLPCQPPETPWHIATYRQCVRARGRRRTQRNVVYDSSSHSIDLSFANNYTQQNILIICIRSCIPSPYFNHAHTTTTASTSNTHVVADRSAGERRLGLTDRRLSRRTRERERERERE